MPFVRCGFEIATLFKPASLSCSLHDSELWRLKSNKLSQLVYRWPSPFPIAEMKTWNNLPNAQYRHTVIPANIYTSYFSQKTFHLLTWPNLATKKLRESLAAKREADALPKCEITEAFFVNLFIV